MMLSLEIPRLAGYMLTGNRSIILQTDGSLAWLYHCALVHTPLHLMNQCYDAIPILCEGQIQFVDPITRQTHPAANLKNCTDRIRSLSQFDMYREDSLYTQTLGNVTGIDPLCLGPKIYHQWLFNHFPDRKILECTLEVNSVVFGTVS